METLKLTQLKSTYWNNSGIYQSEFDKLTKELMPAEGMAETLNGELIRAVNRLYYEYCNNGNCNACEVKYEEEEYFTGEYDDEGEEIWDSEEVECDSQVTAFYSKFLDLIRKEINGIEIDEVVSKIVEFIESNLYGQQKEQFSDYNMNLYDELTDRVVYHVLNNNDKEIPSWYKN